MEVHPDFYPCTDGMHWDPLLKAAPDLIGEFMFMQADVTGRFYYKHSMTRQYVVLDDQGRAWTDTGFKDARQAVLEAAA